MSLKHNAGESFGSPSKNAVGQLGCLIQRLGILVHEKDSNFNVCVKHQVSLTLLPL